MNKQLETFVRNNREALDSASPDPDTWEVISVQTNKKVKFSLLKFLQKLRARFFALNL